MTHSPQTGVEPPRHITRPMARCHHCGTAIDTAEWYPVVTSTDETGALELYSFCDTQCRAAWRSKAVSD
ncbi:MAG: hypothetical protein ABEI77_07455 [Halorientalis sp.]